jgi:hypothetical protein
MSDSRGTRGIPGVELAGSATLAVFGGDRCLPLAAWKPHP